MSMPESPELTEAQRQRDLLRKLADLSRALVASATDLPRLLEVAAQSSADLLGDSAALVLRSGDGRALEVKAAFHRDPSSLAEIRGRIPKRLPADGSETLQAMRVMLGTARVVPASLRSRNGAVEALAIARDVGRADFDEQELAFAREVANTVAAAIANARLLEAQRQQIASLDALVRQRSKEVDGANRAKSAFLATMSHEIRTPMNAIINMTELAMETDAGPRQQHHLSVVKDSANGLLALINDILDFSKIEAEKVELEATAFRLRPLLEEVTNTFRGRVMEKGIEFVVICTPDVPEVVVGDALRLRQVLINLISNAFKFTHQGEVVLRVSPGARGAGEPIRFEIRDTGVGIPAEKQAHLFEPFTQVDSSNTRQYGGTGLGLAICHRLVGLMGGRLEFHSAPGQGTQFSFVARFDRSEEQPSPIRLEPEALARLSVLVVEDNATTRELLLTLLDGFQVRAEAVPTAEAALERIVSKRDAGWPFDVILVDWILPGMDGLEMVRRARALPGGDEHRLVAMSAFGGRNEESRFRDAGVSDFLQKPITRSTLLDVLMTVIGRERTRPVSKPAANDRALAGYRVLVAEDNEANQAVIEELLTRAGIAMELAPDGIVAVEKCSARVFDGVLMDMQMPRLDGLEATRRIRKLSIGANLPIIALTANAIDGDLERCLDAGMNDYVTKPINREQLFTTLRKWLPERHRGAAHPVFRETVPESGPFPEVAGIDVAGALTALEIDFSVFAKMLYRFAGDQPETLEKLLTAGRSGDLAAVQFHAHALAGASGNLRANDLWSLLKSIETAARAGSTIEASLYARVATEADRVFKAIDQLQALPATISSESNAALTRPSTAELRSRLQQLREALAESDVSGATEQLAYLKGKALPATVEQVLTEVRTSVENYDLDTAAPKVEALCVQLDEAA